MVAGYGQYVLKSPMYLLVGQYLMAVTEPTTVRMCLQRRFRHLAAVHRLQPKSVRFLLKNTLTCNAQIPASKGHNPLQTRHNRLPVLRKIRAVCIRPRHHRHPNVYHTQNAIAHYAGPPLAPRPSGCRPLTALNNKRSGYPSAK